MECIIQIVSFQFSVYLGCYVPNYIYFLFHWASLIAHLVKNPPAMQETLVRFLDPEDPLEKG